MLRFYHSQKFFFLTVFVIILLFFSCQSSDDAKRQDQDTVGKALVFSSQDDYLRMLSMNMDTLFEEFVRDGRVDLGWKDEYGSSFLHHAVWMEKVDLVKFLLDSGAAVNARRMDGFTPLHWAAYKGNTAIAKLLVDQGADINSIASGTTPLFWAIARDHEELSRYLLERGADCLAAGEDYPTPLACFEKHMGINVTDGYAQYGSSLIIALLEDRDACQQGHPELPPFPKASLSFEQVSNYLDRTEIQVSVTNEGKGDLFDLVADLSITGTKNIQQKLYFGKISPGNKVVRNCFLSSLDYRDIGKDLSVSVSFTEENNYLPENCSGKITVPVPDREFIVDHLTELDASTVKSMVDNGYFTINDLSRAVILRSSDLTIDEIKPYVETDLIDRTVIDKLIKYEKIPYTASDLVYFAQKKAITQENLELVFLENRIPFDAENILHVAESHYISRQVVEALYSAGISFSEEQVQKLIALKAFSLPEVLYTYTISDGDSASSSGNRDGMIQVGEGVDFDVIVKNNSIFDMSNVTIGLESDDTAIDLFKNSLRLNMLVSGATAGLNATIGVKRSFSGDTLPLRIVVEDRHFGTLIDKQLDVPVGRSVGSPVLSINKKVSASQNLVVKSGAAENASQIAVLSEGAVLDTVGELDEWYKVEIYGKYGWVEKSQVVDFRVPDSHTFLVENRKDFSIDDGTSDTYAERAFVNSRPILEIISPSNNDNVYNRTSMEILAVDRTYGIASVDIRVNGASLEGSGARGLRVADAQHERYRGTYPLVLKKGENEVSVTVYNTKNVASDTQLLHLYSQGIQNPPSLYVLSVGVSDYELSSQNLNYAAGDAQKIAAVFGTQEHAEIYDQVHIKTLLDGNATRANIKDGINTFLSDARVDDMVVLFFAGHGITDSRGRYYLLGYDGDMNNPSANGLKQSDFEDDLIASVQAKKVLVMLDSCQSGGVTGRRGNENITEVVDRLSSATGFTVMSAARGNEYAYENADWHGGAFTLAVEDALAKSRADTNQDGYVDINELDSFVYNKVIELTGSKQHPTSKRYSAESYLFYQVQ
jgi:hypothetical protein